MHVTGYLDYQLEELRFTINHKNFYLNILIQKGNCILFIILLYMTTNTDITRHTLMRLQKDQYKKCPESSATSLLLSQNWGFKDSTYSPQMNILMIIIYILYCHKQYKILTQKIKLLHNNSPLKFESLIVQNLEKYEVCDFVQGFLSFYFTMLSLNFVNILPPPSINRR